MKNYYIRILCIAGLLSFSGSALGISEKEIEGAVKKILDKAIATKVLQKGTERKKQSGFVEFHFNVPSEISDGSVKDYQTFLRLMRIAIDEDKITAAHGAPIVLIPNRKAIVEYEYDEVPHYTDASEEEYRPHWVEGH